MESIIQVNDEITQCKVPLPYALRWVNSYVIRGKDGYTVMDPGLHTEDAERFWQEAMKQIGFRMEDVTQVVLTHHHPDHYGLAGWFQQSSGAPVYLSRAGHDQVNKLWGEEQEINNALIALFRRNGMDEVTLGEIREHMDSFIPLVSPHAQVHYLEEGEPVKMGSKTYVGIHTPGHAFGHLCFYHADTREMFSGDQVIPQISPNVSYLPGIEENPLDSFLTSLSQLTNVKVDIAYPGHRDPFQNFADRTRALIAHHDERLGAIKQILQQPKTGFELCKALFSTQLTSHQLRFAMAETIAHIIYLQELDQLKTMEQQDGWVLYQSK